MPSARHSTATATNPGARPERARGEAEVATDGAQPLAAARGARVRERVRPQGAPGRVDVPELAPGLRAGRVLGGAPGDEVAGTLREVEGDLVVDVGPHLLGRAPREAEQALSAGGGRHGTSCG
jgi:hypothetical protein